MMHATHVLGITLMGVNAIYSMVTLERMQVLQSVVAHLISIKKTIVIRDSQEILHILVEVFKYTSI